MIFLNEDYSALKKSLQGRRSELTKIGGRRGVSRCRQMVGSRRCKLADDAQQW